MNVTDKIFGRDPPLFKHFLLALYQKDISTDLLDAPSGASVLLGSPPWRTSEFLAEVFGDMSSRNTSPVVCVLALGYIRTNLQFSLLMFTTDKRLLKRAQLGFSFIPSRVKNLLNHVSTPGAPG